MLVCSRKLEGHYGSVFQTKQVSVDQPLNLLFKIKQLRELHNETHFHKLCAGWAEDHPVATMTPSHSQIFCLSPALLKCVEFFICALHSCCEV